MERRGRLGGAHSTCGGVVPVGRQGTRSQTSLQGANGGEVGHRLAVQIRGFSWALRGGVRVLLAKELLDTPQMRYGRLSQGQVVAVQGALTCTDRDPEARVTAMSLRPAPTAASP